MNYLKTREHRELESMLKIKKEHKMWFLQLKLFCSITNFSVNKSKNIKSNEI